MKNFKHRNHIFPVILQKEKNGYIVTNPAFEGCYSQGDTAEEALANIKEATELCLEEATASRKKTFVGNISLHLINA
ncbi:MAG: type II toxin-antitoxin system HicB family antitoxin [bacterium]|nr:type II toxin-antitoxin system HicB family antitoxin [bacterium]